LAALSINELGGIDHVPRSYSLGKRAEAQAETRARIVAATVRLFREVGVDAATVPAVARAADVAPATVRNHFPGPTDLANAAATAILEDVGLPDRSIFDGARDLSERVDRLLTEMAAFFERATGWWEVRVADQRAGNAWEVAESAYETHAASLIREAVAPLGDDPAVVATVAAVLVDVYFGARTSGRSSAEAVAFERELLVPWLETRLAARSA
jgi:AcrR family transcriptional regulator